MKLPVIFIEPSSEVAVNDEALIVPDNLTVLPSIAPFGFPLLIFSTDVAEAYETVPERLFPLCDRLMVNEL